MKSNFIIHKLLSSKLFITIVVICSLIAQLNDVFFRDIYRDEFFMALNVRNFQDSPLAPLTFYIGHIATDLFGDNLFTLRVLKYIFYTITIGIGCFFFYKTTDKPRASWLLFALFNFTACVATMDIYNWDTGSYPFMVLTLISALAYNRHCSLFRAIIIGLCCGLMTASRITTAAAIPFLILLIFLCHTPIRHKIRDASVLLFTFIATLLLLALVIYGSPDGLYAAWSPNNIITGHGTSSIAISRMLNDLRWLFCIISLSWMLSLSCFFFAKVAIKVQRHRLVVLLIMSIIVSLFTITLTNYDGTAHVCLWQLSAFVFLFIPQLSHLFNKNDSRHCKIGLIQWILLLFILIPGIGSDHFYERIAPMVFMPLIFAYNYAKHRRLIAALCGFMGIAVLTMVAIKVVGPHIMTRVNLAHISPRSANIYYRIHNTAEIEAQKSLYDNLADKGYHPTYLGHKRYYYIYLFAPDNDYSLQHFHNISFIEDQPYYKRLKDFDALVINEPIYDENNMIQFQQYLSELGFKEQTASFAPLPSTTHVYLR